MNEDDLISAAVVVASSLRIYRYHDRVDSSMRALTADEKKQVLAVVAFAISGK
jgi:hypothetical protein